MIHTVTYNKISGFYGAVGIQNRLLQILAMALKSSILNSLKVVVCLVFFLYNVVLQCIGGKKWSNQLVQ